MRVWNLWLVSLLFGTVALAQGEVSPKDSATLRVMTFNIWVGGELVDFGKVVEAIRAADADVVGLQEAGGNTRRLAEVLGWPYASERHTVISRFPLITPPGDDASYILVQLGPGEVVALANVHLPSDPYGPYEVRDGAALETVLALERATRLSAIEPYLEGWAEVAKTIPIFITGDFNTPSHHDWTEAAAKVRKEIVYPVRWPVTVAVEAAGFQDTYRTAHPNPVAAPGITWTFGYPYPRLLPDEVVDRIDFVFAAGNVEVLGSEIVGQTGGPDTDIGVLPFPSDHRGVVSEVRVRPGVPPAFVSPERVRLELGDPIVVRYHGFGGEGKDRIALVPAGGDAARDTLMWLPPYEASFFGSVTFGSGTLAPGSYEAVLLDEGAAEVARSSFWLVEPGARVALSTGRAVYRAGEPVRASWRDAPAHRADWLGLYRAGEPDIYSAYLGFVYTGARVAGSTTFGPAVLGEAMLPPGAYELRYVIDDGYAVSASIPFRVSE